jgi:multiple sugar transport system permease protein/putative aldouronate transport system permease protein
MLVKKAKEHKTISSTNKKLFYTRGDRIFLAFNNVFLAIILLLVAYPLIFIVSSSFSSTSAVINGRVWLFPVNPSLEAYKAVFENKYIWQGYLNSTIYMLTGTLLNVVVTILAAYPLSRKDFKARNPVMLFFAFTMFFSGGLIPTYMLIGNLGLMNTRWAMILPGALSVWNMIITRTYFQSNISTELLEAAQLDGCSDFKFLVKIVIPLSSAIIAVISLFYAVGHWNAYFNALIYLNDKKLYPLQLVLRELLIMQVVDPSMVSGELLKEMLRKQAMRELLKYAVIVVASLPVMIMYPFVQKYFVKGVMIGSLKG